MDIKLIKKKLEEYEKREKLKYKERRRLKGEKVYNSKGELIGYEEKKIVNYAILSLKVLDILEEVYYTNVELSDIVKISKKYIKGNKKMYKDEVVELEDKIINDIKEKLEKGEIEEI